MTHLFPAGLLLAVIAANPGQRSPGALAWDKAAREIRRLPPSAFPQLPAAVRSELNRRQCTIPQADGFLGPHNVISGNFINKAHTDWAVLCSRDGDSTILVFSGASIEVVAQLATGPDKTWLQTVGEGKIGYSRRITAVDRAAIVGYQRAFGGPLPPRIDHQGIEDSFVEKASVILYYYQGRWLKLTGAD